MHIYMASTGEEEERFRDDDQQQQLNLTIDVDEDDPPFSSLLPDDDHHQQQNPNNIKADAVLKAGLFITLISIGGILYPPLPGPAAAADNAQQHLLLSKIMFHFLVWISLAIGVSLILLSTIILNLIPTSIVIAKPLAEIGWALTSFTLGYGSSLVLMVSSSPWFALYLIFLSIPFMKQPNMHPLPPSLPSSDSIICPRVPIS